MWLIPDCPSLASVRALAGSTKGSDEQSPEPAFSLTLSGTHTLRPSSWRGWKTRAWSPRLFGAAILNGSTPDSLREWISSRLGSRASRSPSPASGGGSRTSGGSGLPSLPSLGRWDPSGFFLRTSQDLFDKESAQSSMIWPGSGAMRNGSVFVRPQSEPPMCGIGGSVWPTAGANDWKGSYRPGQRRGQLSEAAEQLWPTPRTITGGAESAERKRELGRTASGGGDLQSAVASWNGRRAHSRTTSGREFRRVLNPRFVEALMGFRIGWTDCAASGTPSSPPRLSSPSASCTTD